MTQEEIVELRINLLNNPSWKDINLVLSRVTFRAFEDEQLKTKALTGLQLCNLFLSRWRNGHVQLLSTVYNKTRWTIRLGSDMS